MKMTMPREFYVPKNSVAKSDPNSDAVAYLYNTASGKPGAAIFVGKQSKPISHYYYQTEAARDKAVTEAFESRQQSLAFKAEMKAKTSSPHTLKVGDILYSSWGYDQTNIDFYQVTNVPGPMTVEITPIASESGPETGFMSAQCSAVKDAFKGSPMIKRANSYNSVRIASYASASLWDGKPKTYSWYA